MREVSLFDFSFSLAKKEKVCYNKQSKKLPNGGKEIPWRTKHKR